MIDEEEYERWKEERESAELSVEQREDKINQSNYNIEQKLQLLGENLSLSLSTFLPPSFHFFCVRSYILSHS